MFKVVLLSLLMSTYLLSSVGIIYSIKGKATLNRDGEMIIPSKNFQLEKNDTIRTGDGSSARIKFNDNTLVTLGKNSAVNIADYVFDENNQTNSKSNLNFFKGSFKSITGKIGKLNPSAFKLKTKTASIGIRGTIVLGNQNKIMCTQGAVEVTVAGQTVVIPQGTKTLTIPGQAPIPEAIKPQDIEEFDNAMPIEEEQTQETTDNNDQKEDNQDEQNSEQNTDSEKEESTVQEDDKQTTNNEQNSEATSEETSTENIATQQTTNENPVIVNTEAITNVETLTESTTETTNTVEKINEVDTQTDNSGTSTSDSSLSTSSSTANTDPVTTTTPATLEWNAHINNVTQNVQNELDTVTAETTTFDKTISNKTNEGYFIGYQINESSNRVVGAVESMLFNSQDNNVNPNSGELNGFLDSNFSVDSLMYFNTSTTAMKFVEMDPTEVTSSYTSEDDNLILGQAQTSINAVDYILDIGFQTLKDRVANDNSLSSVDDGSSWGYWQAVNELGTIDYRGWWISGDSNVDADYISNLVSSNTALSYVGHIMGDTFTSTTGGPSDRIILDSNNSLHMNINFGSGNPVDITKMTFNTEGGWQYSNTTGFTTNSSTLDSVNITNNGSNYTVTDVIADVSNATDSLKFDGSLYGLEANSVGGIVTGNIQGVDGTSRHIQGIFKAAKQ